jgi:transposase
MEQINTHIYAGKDTGKSKFDAAICTDQNTLVESGFTCFNTHEGRLKLLKFFKTHRVTRVGIEASGGYEIEVVDELRETGFEVTVLQPQRVKFFAKYKGHQAKNDRLDAILIAKYMAAQTVFHAPNDTRLAAFAEHLTYIDQIGEDISRLKIRRERYRNKEILDKLNDEIKRLKCAKTAALKALEIAIKSHDDLANKLDLLASIQGIGAPTALALIIRMPELGTLTREQAASLLGVAPFDNESGNFKGKRRTGGGRARARTSLFCAAQAAALKWNPALMELYARLKKAGKHHNIAIIACVRKLIIYANTVLAKNKPWEIRL